MRLFKNILDLKKKTLSIDRLDNDCLIPGLVAVLHRLENSTSTKLMIMVHSAHFEGLVHLIEDLGYSSLKTRRTFTSDEELSGCLDRLTTAEVLIATTNFVKSMARPPKGQLVMQDDILVAVAKDRIDDLAWISELELLENNNKQHKKNIFIKETDNLFL